MKCAIFFALNTHFNAHINFRVKIKRKWLLTAMIWYEWQMEKSGDDSYNILQNCDEDKEI